MSKMVITSLIADPDPLRQPWKPGDPLPTQIKMLRFGDNPGFKGNFIVTEKTLANLEANQRKARRDHVVIDFNHNTVPGTPAFLESKEPRPVAARKAKVVVTPDRCIALEAPDWTEKGISSFGDFADFSPAVIHDPDTMEVVGIHSAALVRHGSNDGLTFCSADMLSVEDEPKEESMKDLLAALVAAKMLPDGATEADVSKLMVDMFGKIMAMKETVAECTADKIKGLAAEGAKPMITALTAEVTDLKTRADEHRKERICDLARFEGKVIQLDKTAIAALSADQLQEHVSKLAVTVPLGQRTVITPAGADPAAKSFTDEQAAVARACGNDPEKVYAKKG